MDDRSLLKSMMSATNAFAVVPSDANDLPTWTRGLYVGSAGHVKVTLTGGSTVTFQNLVAGIIHPIMAKRVYSTGTTATNIVGVY